MSELAEAFVGIPFTRDHILTLRFDDDHQVWFALAHEKIGHELFCFGAGPEPLDALRDLHITESWWTAQMNKQREEDQGVVDQ